MPRGTMGLGSLPRKRHSARCAEGMAGRRRLHVRGAPGIDGFTCCMTRPRPCRRAARRVRRSGLRVPGRSRGGTCSRSRRSRRLFSQPASRTRSTTPRTSSTVKATCRSPGRFAAGASSPAPAEGDWKRTTSNTSLPSGARAITTSTVTFSRPMIRSIHSPPKTPGSPQSKPSSARNRTVSSRSSTTSPMWTKLVTPGRWLSVEVK
jgi:hypothetical protein